jgi:hypothetical protein
MFNGTTDQQGAQVAAYESDVLSQRCWLFLRPLFQQLAQHLDRRLVKTFLDLVFVILLHRNRQQGLLLSELGDHLLGAHRGPAGSKRIAKLLHSPRWQAAWLEAYLWERGDQRVNELLHPKEEVYVIWDESVLEKPESLQAEGLCAVRSTKAARLKRIKPGFFNPPGGRPIFVPGFNWLQVVVTGLHGVPTLTHVRWWTTRGERCSDKRTQEQAVLQRVSQLWGSLVIHIWDRGFAGAPWTLLALAHRVRFIVRWKKDYKLVGPDGQAKKPWEITRGKRSWDHRLIWDARRRCERKTGVIAVPVHLPEDDHPLWLVVSRPGPGRKPWYLLTSEPVNTAEEAWRIVIAYARRWQIEMSIRFTKSELAFECPRLHKWESRLKFLWIATLAYAFLLSLLISITQPGGDWLLRNWCHRKGKRSRETPAPLYRLRLALSRLWLYFRPPPLPRLSPGLNSG